MDDLTVLERHALLAWWLCHGDCVPLPDVARAYGMTVPATARMAGAVMMFLDAPEPRGDNVARTVYIVQRLAAGERLTTRQVADTCATTRQTAYNSLTRLARVLPIYPDERYRWQACDFGEIS